MGVMVWMVAMAQTATLRLTVVAMIMATVIRQLIVIRWGYVSLKRHMAAVPPERSLDASAIYGSRTTRKHPFQFQKRNSAGKNKKIGKGFFWWGERARAPAGVGAELRDFLGNRFGLRRKIAPNRN